MADTKVASMNFLNALERISKLVEQYKTQNVTFERDIPILQQTVGGVWKKEDELKQLKSEVAALERKIQLELAPQKNEAGQEQAAARQSDVKVQNQTQHVPTENPAPTQRDEQFIRDHVIVARPAPAENRGLKMCSASSRVESGCFCFYETFSFTRRPLATPAYPPPFSHAGNFGSFRILPSRPAPCCFWCCTGVKGGGGRVRRDGSG